MKTPPPDFDPEWYSAVNPDLRSLSTLELAGHFRRFGLSEGRVCSRITGRHDLVALIEPDDQVLEIGPFTTPLVRGGGVKYFDILDGRGLLERASRIGYPVAWNPRIDFVSPVGDLSVVEGRFDVVVGSHVIEHQPDLVRHLRDVSRILGVSGRYLLVIPDKRYCFDHFIAESTIAGIIEAHVESRTHHAVASIVEHSALVTHNDSEEHWAGNHGRPRASESTDWVTIAMREAVEARSSRTFVDVHAWQFTPHGFRDIIELLLELGLSPLSVEAVYPTPRGSPEFCAVLRLA